MTLEPWNVVVVGLTPESRHDVVQCITRGSLGVSDSICQGRLPKEVDVIRLNGDFVVKVTTVGIA